MYQILLFGVKTHTLLSSSILNAMDSAVAVKTDKLLSSNILDVSYSIVVVVKVHPLLNS